MKDALAVPRPAPPVESRAVFFIVLRPCPDWKNLTPAAFREQSRQYCRSVKRPPEQVNESVAVWDSTFGVSYLETRQAMKDISLANFRAVRDSRMIDLEQVTAEGAEPGIYQFIDDDDWISPDILSRLNASVRTDRRAYLWGSVIFGGFSKVAVELRQFDGFCYTNNYALDYSYFSGRPDLLAAVSQHMDAEENIPKREFCEVREYLSVTNKNPSSTIFLEYTLKKKRGGSAGLAKAVANFYKRLEHLNAPPDLAWVEPYVLQVKDFYSRVLKSRK
jgi:hypothetical protein